MKVSIVLALALAGCYSPDIGDCQYRCDNSAADPAKACPDGMFCSLDDFCVNDPTFNCGGEPDGGPPQDTPGPGDGGPPGDTSMMMDASIPDGAPADAAPPQPEDPSELAAPLGSVREQPDDVTLDEPVASARQDLAIP